jgi:hypothetical protein
MANGKNAISRWILNGKVIDAPTEWSNVECIATFGKEAVQATITIDKFTFVNDEATDLINHINKGTDGGVGITEGLPFNIELHNNTNNISVFNGMVDLSDGVEINEFSNKVIATLRLRDELYTLEEKLSSLSYGYLAQSLGIFTSSDYTDIEYVVENKINVLETIIMSIAIYMMTKELIDSIVKITKDTGLSAADTTGGQPLPTATLSGIIMAIVIVTVNVTYAALLLVAILKLASTLISQLIPVKRKAKALKLKTALTKVCSHLGYGFVSKVTDLDNVYYIPSNYSFDSITSLGIIDQWVGNKKGIPSSSDYGYNCADMFEIAKKLFNGKFAIINGSVVFHCVDDLAWVQYSTFKLPSVRNKIKTYNTDELIANRYLTFDVDFSDEFTIEDYKGTSYEVITNQQITNDSKLRNVRGLDEIRFGVCLANRKSQISGVESLLISLASTIDGIIELFGGKGMYVKMIKTSIGLMRISTNNWTKPKVVKVDSNKRLVNRNSWSAKYIYETYYKGRSFVSTVNGLTYYGQKEVYKNVRIPFGLNNFVQLIDNSYAYLPDATLCKITSCKYRFNADTAIVDYYIRKPYTANLVETFIEPTNQ